MTNENKRVQRCIELYERLKAQFIRSHTLDDAAKCYYPNEEGKAYNRKMAEQEAALFVSLLMTFTAHMTVDDFNSNWFFYSDYIYQDEDLEAQECLHQQLEKS